MTARRKPAEAIRTAVAGLAWPALPGGAAATLIALHDQLERSQWWSPEQLESAQLLQLRALLEHCWTTIPFHRDRLESAGWTPGARLDMPTWRRIPPLTREDVQGAGAALHSSAVPKAHGSLQTTRTSGSTAKPVAVVKTAAEGYYWHACVLREHAWHGHDFRRRLAVIRVLADGVGLPPEGLRQPSWGGLVGRTYHTGPGFALTIRSTTEQQLAWLREVRPGYLLTHPTAARALAQLAMTEGVALAGLQAVMTMGEICSPDVRAAVAEAWNVPVHDAYSSQEVGYMALQCPDGDGYHLQSESAMVEVLNDAGLPCAPGRMGRVVATPLHNYAMPLIRYEIGDHAEAGGACSCGRGLPLVTRIAGRVRNMMRLPGGGLIWPLLASQDYRDIAPIRQAQIAQVALDRLEARLVPERPLSAAEEDALRAKIVARIGHAFAIDFVYVDDIPRGPGGKFEDFRCELPAGEPGAASRPRGGQ